MNDWLYKETIENTAAKKVIEAPIMLPYFRPSFFKTHTAPKTFNAFPNIIAEIGNVLRLSMGARSKPTKLAISPDMDIEHRISAWQLARIIRFFENIKRSIHGIVPYSTHVNKINRGFFLSCLV